ncbi:MAG: Gfo/Idh/MocA family oxidoreductase [Acidobacteria bacterium]|nr:Gfo/Idh/MocA family oxidoreductase [Acidobacteriota bacterium]
MTADTGAPLRFGLIGCGRIGVSADERFARWQNARAWLPYSHLTAMLATAELTVAAVCDVNAAAAADAQRRADVPQAYTDYREMIAREALDGIAIATHAQHRHELIAGAVLAGVRGLYCEKPLCTSLEQADAIVDLLNNHGVQFVYGTRRRFMAAFLRAKTALDEGAIGPLQTIIVMYPRSRLLWDHPHSVDLLQFFSGDATPVSVEARAEEDPAGDLFLTFAVLQFASGCTGYIVQGQGYDVSLHGPNGILHVKGDGWALEHRRPVDPTRDYGIHVAQEMDEPAPSESGTVTGFRALCGAMRGQASRYRVEWARQNMEILFACAESARSGAAVRWPVSRRGVELTGLTAAPVR